MCGKEQFFPRGSFIIGGGQITRFRVMAWKTPLSTEYPSLYTVQHKNLNVADEMNQTH
jgi:hypothetical protein